MTTTNVDVKVRALGTAQYSASMGKMAASTSAVSAAGGAATASLGKMGKALGFATAGFAALAAAKAGLSLVLDYDQAFVGVTKTVDGTTEQLAALRSGILDMSRELPTSAAEIAGVAEAAGQLGISTENILGFTRVMVDLGETTNLTAEQAATNLARLANITQLPQDEFERLGSTVVELGNNSATTEAEIVEMGTRLAAAGSIAGFSEANILSLSASLSSVGVNAEAGGSAFSRVISDMNSSVISGNENLEVFAETAGLSANQFERQWREGPAEALNLFIAGLGEIDAEGGDVQAVLDSLGLGGIRVGLSLKSAAVAGDLFAETTALGTKAWEENIALTNEAEKRYESASAQLAIMGNNFKAFVIEQGQRLLPAFVDLIGDLGDVWGDVEGALIAVGGVAGPLFESWLVFMEGLIRLGARVGETLVRFFGPVVIGGIVAGAEALGFLYDTVGSLLLAMADSEEVATALAVVLAVVLAQAAATAAAALLSMAGSAIVTGLLNVAVAVEKVIVGMRGLTLASAAAKAAPVVALLAVAGAAFAAKGALDDARGRAQEFARSLTEDVDLSSYESVTTALGDIGDEAEVLRQQLDDKGLGERFVDTLAEMGNNALGWLGVSSDMEDSTLDLAAGLEALSEEAARVRREFADQLGIDPGTFAEAIAGAVNELRGFDNDIEPPSLDDVMAWDLTGLAPANAEIERMANGLADLAVAEGVDLSGLNAEEATEALLSAYEASKDLTPAQRELGEAAADLSGEFTTLTDRVNAYQQALDAIFNPTKNVFDAQTKAIRAWTELNLAAKEGELVFGDFSEEALDTRDTLSSTVDAQTAFIAATLEQNGNIEAAGEAYGQLREDLISTILPFVDSQEAAEDLVDTLGLTPENIEAAIALTGVELTEEEIASITEGLYGIDETTASATVDVDVRRAEFDRLVADMGGRFNNARIPVAVGAIETRADGGISRQAQIQSGDNAILWAEAGPEAYIPLSPGKLNQSAPILAEVADIMGFGLVKMANGGTIGSSRRPYEPSTPSTLEGESVERRETTARAIALSARRSLGVPGALFGPGEEARFAPHPDGPELFLPPTDDERYGGLNVGEIRASESVVAAGGRVLWDKGKYVLDGKERFLDDLADAAAFASKDRSLVGLFGIGYNRAKEYADWGFSIGEVTAADIIRQNRGEVFADGVYRDRYGDVGEVIAVARFLAGLSGRAVDSRPFSGTVVPFADGGIVTRPTVGLLGEAGPEAVIPLDSARRRLLGERAVGGGAGIDERKLAQTIAAEVGRAIRDAPPPDVKLDGRSVAKNQQGHLRALAREQS